MKSEENTTANDLRDLDKAATQGELEPHSRQGKNVDAWVGADKYKHFSFHDSVADAAFITAIVNAYRSGQLVHVDEVEKLREALAWYGEQARLCRLIHSQGDLGRHALQNDGGTIARAALGDSQ